VRKYGEKKDAKMGIEDFIRGLEKK